MTYSEKLKDPRWKEKAKSIYRRDNNTCQLCGSNTRKLHCHHLKYETGEPWETDDKHLITLCENCHNMEHSQNLDETYAICKYYFGSYITKIQFSDLMMAFNELFEINHIAGKNYFNSIFGNIEILIKGLE